MTDDSELILIDDESPKICNRYVERYDNVVVIHRKNGGAGAARNTGLEVARGKMITFVNPDDCVSKDYIESLKKFINIDKTTVAFSYMLRVDKNGKTVNTDFILPNHSKLSSDSAILLLDKTASLNGLWNKLYNKSIIDESHCIRFKERSEPGEDLIFNCKYFERVKEVIFSEKELYVYFRQGNIEESLSHKFYSDLYEKTLCCIEARNKLYNRLGMISKQYEAELDKQNFYYIFKCISNMYRPKYKMRRNERIYFYKEIIHKEDIRRWARKREAQSDKLIKLFCYIYATKSPFLWILYTHFYLQ